ncbi:MAG TPA: hypothetical protein VEI57_01385 [Nitrospirota bacterium]|nr:hypothetical protein [Nitrospirota bacterium]
MIERLQRCFGAHSLSRSVVDELLEFLYLLFVNLTEISALWQVVADEAIYLLIRSSLPRRKGMGKVALDAKRYCQILVPLILSAIISGKRPLCLRGQFLACPSDRLIGFGSGLVFQLREPKDPGLALDHAFMLKVKPGIDWLDGLADEFLTVFSLSC